MERDVDEWEVELRYTSYPSEVRDFWEEERKKRKAEHEALEKARKKIEEEIKATERMLKEHKDEIEDDERKSIDEAVQKIKDTLGDKDFGWHGPTLNTKMEEFKSAITHLTEIEDSANEVILAEAHDVAFEAEKAILDSSSNLNLTQEIAKVDGALTKVKSLLLDEHADADKVHLELAVLKNDYGKFKEKITELELQEERMQVEEEARKKAEEALRMTPTGGGNETMTEDELRQAVSAVQQGKEAGDASNDPHEAAVDANGDAVDLDGNVIDPNEGAVDIMGGQEISAEPADDGSLVR